MANGNGINVILAVREHIGAEIEETRGEITATEQRLAEQREHLYALLAIQHAAGAPAKLIELPVGAVVEPTQLREVA